jgi:hypothetical protein
VNHAEPSRLITVNVRRLHRTRAVSYSEPEARLSI